VALLNTVFINATTSYLRTHGPAATALGVVHGYNVAFTVSAVLLGTAALALFVFIRTDRKPETVAPQPVDTPELVPAGA
jgi:hypothetical protein